MQVVAEITKARVPTIAELNETWLSLDGLTEQTITDTAKVTTEKKIQSAHLAIVFFCQNKGRYVLLKTAQCFLQFLIEQNLIDSAAPTYSKYVNRSY